MSVVSKGVELSVNQSKQQHAKIITISSFTHTPGLKNSDTDKMKRPAIPYLLKTGIGLSQAQSSSNEKIDHPWICHWALAIESDGWWVVIEATQDEDGKLVPMYNKGFEKPDGSLHKLNKKALLEEHDLTEISFPLAFEIAKKRRNEIPEIRNINISPFDIQEIAGRVESNNTEYNKWDNNCQTWLIQAANMLKNFEMAKIREISPELLERAKQELNEDPARRDADIAHIREWLKKQPHIKANPDDQMIITFLRGCKFSLERTKEKIDMYYTMRTALPEFFDNRDTNAKGIREMLELGTLMLLPGFDPKGRLVLLGRFGKQSPDKHQMEDMCKLNTMMMDYLVREVDETVICGSMSLMDMSDMTLAHAAQMTPSLTKKMMTLFQDAYPFRPKGLHYIHNPSIFETVFNVFKTFAKEKIRKRMHIHGENLEALYQHIPQEILPTEYGGKAGTIKEINDAWMARLESYHDWFLAEAKCKVDESKRPGRPKTQQDLFGLEGSFRQLNVD